MKPIRWVVLGIVASLVVAALAYFWATKLMDSLYAYRSPLKDNPPSAGEPLGEPLTRRVIVVLIDALRYDTSTKSDVMPFLNQLRRQGASAVMHSKPPSFSVPGYSVLMTGAWPELSDGPAMNPDDDVPPRTWTQDNLFSAAHRAGLRTAVSGFDWFRDLIPQEAVDASFYTLGEDATADRAVVDAALPWLASDEYQFILIHIDQVDYAGHHEGGPLDPRWDAAAKRADDLLRETVSLLDLSLDTVIVFSDHGQIDAGGHGGHDPVTLVEPFVAAGARIVPGEYNNMQMIDVAPTIAVLLGTNIPASSEGLPMVEMLEFKDQWTTIWAKTREQQNQLLETYEISTGFTYEGGLGEWAVEKIEGIKASRLTDERLPRFIVAGILALLPAFFLFKYRGKQVMWFLAGTALYLAVFHLRYAILQGRTYSLSSVLSSDDIVGSTALSAAIAFALAWLLVVVALRLYSDKPLQATNTYIAFAWTALYIVSIPALWSYAYNGAVVTWTLPDMASMFMGFLSILQMLVVAALSLIFMGITPLVALVVQRSRVKR